MAFTAPLRPPEWSDGMDIQTFCREDGSVKFTGGQKTWLDVTIAQWQLIVSAEDVSAALDWFCSWCSPESAATMRAKLDMS